MSRILSGIIFIFVFSSSVFAESADGEVRTEDLQKTSSSDYSFRSANEALNEVKINWWRIESFLKEPESKLYPNPLDKHPYLAEIAKLKEKSRFDLEAFESLVKGAKGTQQYYQALTPHEYSWRNSSKHKEFVIKHFPDFLKQNPSTEDIKALVLGFPEATAKELVVMALDIEESPRQFAALAAIRMDEDQVKSCFDKCVARNLDRFFGLKPSRQDSFSLFADSGDRALSDKIFLKMTTEDGNPANGVTFIHKKAVEEGERVVINWALIEEWVKRPEASHLTHPFENSPNMKKIWDRRKHSVSSSTRKELAESATTPQESFQSLILGSSTEGYQKGTIPVEDLPLFSKFKFSIGEVKELIKFFVPKTQEEIVSHLMDATNSTKRFIELAKLKIPYSKLDKAIGRNLERFLLLPDFEFIDAVNLRYVANKEGLIKTLRQKAIERADSHFHYFLTLPSSSIWGDKKDSYVDDFTLRNLNILLDMGFDFRKEDEFRKIYEEVTAKAAVEITRRAFANVVSADNLLALTEPPEIVRTEEKSGWDKMVKTLTHDFLGRGQTDFSFFETLHQNFLDPMNYVETVKQTWTKDRTTQQILHLLSPREKLSPTASRALEKLAIQNGNIFLESNPTNSEMAQYYQTFSSPEHRNQFMKRVLRKFKTAGSLISLIQTVVDPHEKDELILKAAHQLVVLVATDDEIITLRNELSREELREQYYKNLTPKTRFQNVIEAFARWCGKS